LFAACYQPDDLSADCLDSSMIGENTRVTRIVSMTTRVVAAPIAETAELGVLAIHRQAGISRV
jgi:hypothetical protein